MREQDRLIVNRLKALGVLHTLSYLGAIYDSTFANVAGYNCR